MQERGKNKPQKINPVLNRGNANAMVKEPSPEVPSTAPLMKNSSYLTGHRLAVQR